MALIGKYLVFLLDFVATMGYFYDVFLLFDLLQPLSLFPNSAYVQ